VRGQTPSNQIANVLLRIIILCSEGSLFHFRPMYILCPTTLNLPYSEREIKIEGFGGRPPFGGRPGARGPSLNPALAVYSVHRCQRIWN